MDENIRQPNLCVVCEECGGELSFPHHRRGHVETCQYCGAFVDVLERNGGRREPPAVDSAADVDPTTSVASPSRSQLWQDVGAVTCVALIPWWFGCVGSLVNGTSWAGYFNYFHWHLIVTGLQVSVPLLLLSRSRAPRWAECGLVKPEWIPDMAVGGGVWIAGTIAWRFVWAWVPSTWRETPPAIALEFNDGPQGLLQYLLLLAACAAVGFTEEFAIRGFLFTRLELLTRSRWGTILLTTVVFASYHAYQGVGRMLATAGLGLVYGMAFCLMRRIWPLAIGHAITDIMYHLAG